MLPHNLSSLFLSREGFGSLGFSQGVEVIGMELLEIRRRPQIGQNDSRAKPNM